LNENTFIVDASVKLCNK